MVELRQAVEGALEFSATLGSNVLPVNEPLLEEVESDDTENAWLITLSFELPPNSVKEHLTEGVLGQLSRAERLRNRARVYRRFKIDKGSGRVISMKSVNLG